MLASAIPSALREEVERSTACVIAAEHARGGGGASRQGAEVTLRDAGGAERRCYLAWDVRASDPLRRAFFDRETAILQALSGPLAEAGVRAAPLIGSFPSHLALLSAFVGGNDRFPHADDKVAVAQDFVGQLAVLHRIDAGHPALAALGDPAEPPSVRIAARVAELQGLNLAHGRDPIHQLALAWLAANVPPDRGPSVVLHGDAGPGNFLFEGSRVTALVDWEFAHLGDPMEDLAQIWVRSLIQPFIPMRDVFNAYEAASGTPVDLARIKYHRLYFQLGFMVAGQAAAANADARLGATGTAMLYGTMHRRVVVRAVAELAGIALVDPVLPECPPDWTDRGFAIALDDLRDEIVPAASTQRAAVRAKELARMVKFWRKRASHGAAHDAAERAEIAQVLGQSHATLFEARSALAQAISEAVALPVALQLCHNRMARETAIMADAMGALATTWYDDVAEGQGQRTGTGQ